MMGGGAWLRAAIIIIIIISIITIIFMIIINREVRTDMIILPSWSAHNHATPPPVMQIITLKYEWRYAASPLPPITNDDFKNNSGMQPLLLRQKMNHDKNSGAQPSPGARIGG